MPLCTRAGGLTVCSQAWHERSPTHCLHKDHRGEEVVKGECVRGCNLRKTTTKKQDPGIFVPELHLWLFLLFKIQAVSKIHLPFARNVSCFCCKLINECLFVFLSLFAHLRGFYINDSTDVRSIYKVGRTHYWWSDLGSSHRKF